MKHLCNLTQLKKIYNILCNVFAFLILPKLRFRSKDITILIYLSLFFPAIQLNLFFFFFNCYFLCCGNRLFSALWPFFLLCSYQDKTYNFSLLQLSLSSLLYLAFSEENIYFITGPKYNKYTGKNWFEDQFYFLLVA